MIYSIMCRMATNNGKEALYEKLLLELRRGVLMLFDSRVTKIRREILALERRGVEVVLCHGVDQELESQGLLSSDWQVVDDTRPRRYYKMSQEGEMVFANLTQEWQALVVVMNQLLGLTTK